MPKPSVPMLALCAAAAAALCALPAAAQSLASVKEAVQKSLQVNPEVGAKLHAFLAQGEAVNAAGAGFKPRLDFSAGGGVDVNRDAGMPQQKLKRAGAGLTLTQLLWDGLGTHHEVDRAGHERLARWFEFVDASEQVALEASRAVYDLQRERRLVQLAEDNVAQHKAALAKIDSRAKSGVGRGVDLDQVKARLALAESNLETELANLHDVAARFQRVIGDAPTADPSMLELLSTGLPVSPTDAVQSAIGRNPLISAGVESLRAARSGEAVRRSALQPRVEARARAGGGHNYNGTAGRQAEGGVELVMSWNLYDGGGDRARIAEQGQFVQQAMDLRDKACRDVRQTVLIAYNDATKLGNQIGLLERNTQAIERAREAYRQQFDIGQRSLLDLLNAENEAYTARRSLLNAQYDRAVAHARVHAAVSQLNVQLGIARDALPADVKQWNAGDDGAGRCTPQVVDVNALRIASAAPTPAASAAPVAAVAQPVREPEVTVAPIGGPALPKALLGAITERVDAWARAQRSRDLESFTAVYLPDFAGAEGSPASWRAKQARAFAGKKAPSIKVSGLSASELPDGQVQTRFRQGTGPKDAAEKVLTWKIVDGRWLIAKEATL